MMEIEIGYLQNKIIRITYGTNNSVHIQKNILPEIYSWCKENIPEAKIGDLGYRIEEHMYYVYIYLISEEDLIAFKLTWS